MNKYKKRILFVGAFADSQKDGGVGGQLFACKALVESRISEDYIFKLIDTTASTNKKRIYISKFFFSSIRLLKFLYFLTFTRVDIVLAFCSTGFSFLEKGLMIKVAKCFGKKTILAPRSGFIQRDIEKSKLFERLVCSVLVKSDIIICQSEYWNSYYSQLLKNNSSTSFCTVHNWLELSIYLNLPINKDCQEVCKVLFLGWVTENKGIYTILEAAKLMRGLPIQFLIGGEGDASEDVKQIIATNNLEDSVKVLGWVNSNDKIKYLGSSDIFILPSYFEGYPNAIIEAMASGLPVVCTNIASNRGIVEHMYTGMLVNVNSPEEIASSLVTLIENKDLRLKMGKQARDVVTDRNDINIAVEKFRKIFD